MYVAKDQKQIGHLGLRSKIIINSALIGQWDADIFPAFLFLPSDNLTGFA